MVYFNGWFIDEDEPVAELFSKVFEPRQIVQVKNFCPKNSSKFPEDFPDEKKMGARRRRFKKKYHGKRCKNRTNGFHISHYANKLSRERKNVSVGNVINEGFIAYLEEA